ncbi:phosphoribosyltransferase [Candidatus Kaiserbacteria bacterium]|nr:phosphoribosyltransferase [Candidatus Kaiserbacteria bacterium]
MTEDEVLEVLQKVGAFHAGHFVFTSWRHSDTYVNKDALYPYTHDTSKLCREFAERFKDSGVQVVIGPAVAAAILSQWTAYHLTDILGKEVFAAYADKDGQGGFIVRRGYDKVVAGKKVLVVEDLTTTGGSIKKVVDVARFAGADVIGVGVLCNRGGVTSHMIGNPPRFESLVKIELDSWDEADCDLCKTGIPVNIDVGHGREFVAKSGKGKSASGGK